MTAEEYRNYLEQDFSDVDINEMTGSTDDKSRQKQNRFRNGEIFF